MQYTLIISSLSASSPQPSAKEYFVTWLFFTIVLSILPLFFSYVVLMIFVKRNTQWKEFVDLIKDGELFFFSTTLAATSLNKLQSLPQSATVSSIQVSLWAILLFSTFCFGLTVYDKLDQLSSNLRFSLLNMQYRISRYRNLKIKRPNVLLPDIGNMELKLEEVNNQLEDLQKLAADIDKQLKSLKIPSSQSSPSRHPDGVKERIWGVAITAISCAIVVCILSYMVYLYGGS